MGGDFDGDLLNPPSDLSLNTPTPGGRHSGSDMNWSGNVAIVGGHGEKADRASSKKFDYEDISPALFRDPSRDGSVEHDEIYSGTSASPKGDEVPPSVSENGDAAPPGRMSSSSEDSSGSTLEQWSSE